MNTLIIDTLHCAEPTLVQSALARVSRWNPDDTEATHAVHVLPREASGWLEYHLVMNAALDGGFVRGQSFLVAMIQRQPGDPVEFHS